jgi:hypothetical protein
MNDMRHYINLIETLSEAPIDDFKRAADKDLGISQGQMDNDDAKLFGAFIGGAIGIASPFFMDIDFILKVLGATFGAAVGSGLGIGLATKPIDFEQVSIEKRKYADEVIKGKQIKPEIIADLNKFNQYLVNNVPDTITKYALELKQLTYNKNFTDSPNYHEQPYQTAQQDPEHETMSDYGIEDKVEDELNSKALVLRDIISDYLEKQNIVYDNLAKKHGLSPIQLGAIQYIHLGSEIEETFLKGIQSKLSDKGTQ